MVNQKLVTSALVDQARTNSYEVVYRHDVTYAFNKVVVTLENRISSLHFQLLLFARDPRA
jgi:hypothetical protein